MYTFIEKRYPLDEAEQEAAKFILNYSQVAQGNRIWGERINALRNMAFDGFKNKFYYNLAQKHSIPYPTSMDITKDAKELIVVNVEYVEENDENIRAGN